MTAPPSHPFGIRPATPEDAVAIAHVHVAAWQDTYAGILPASFLARLSVHEDTRRWQQLIADRTRGLFVRVSTARPDGIVGFAVGGPNRRGVRAYVGELQAIYLRRSHQRQGIGTALTGAVADELAARDMSSMIVWALAKNDLARQFYRALGGRPAGRRKLEIAGVTLDAVAYGWPDTSTLKNGRTR
ncbi:MAG TPA: GNAT family N-acetyltransferase [Vicinamibacterales bacterium]|nr:GNAT family N-acetyltransferase [Vicinamibacterales bacterium]